jgi:hypothetical protein
MRPHALVQVFRRAGRGSRSRSKTVLGAIAIVAALTLGGPAAAVICWDDLECPDYDPYCNCHAPPQPAHSLEVSLNPLTATPDPNTSTTTQTDWGIAATTTASRFQPGAFSWHFVLGFGQHIDKLPNGSLAVVTDIAAPSDIDPSNDDYADAEPVAPADLEPETPWVEDEAAAADESIDDTGGPAVTEPFDDPDELDGTWEHDATPGAGDPESPEAAAMADSALDAFAYAQSHVNGVVAAVVRGPTATNSAGEPIPASFTVEGDVVWLNVTYQFNGFSDWVSISSEILEEVDAVEPTGEPSAPAGATSAASADTAAAVPASCPFRAKVVTYNPNGWVQLFEALKANPTPCAEYYIVIPPPARAKTRVQKCRQGSPPGQCNRIVDYIRSGGSNFHPVAEFHWGGWRNVTGWSWQRKGMEFRKRMRAAGYEIGRGETWAINEFPSTLRYKSSVRANAMAAASGLFRGFRGYANATGIPFVVGQGQEMVNMSVYKPRLRNFTSASTFWNTMRRYTRFWGQEAYTNCYRSCVPGYQEPTRAKYVNAYVHHPARFAYAGGSASAAARSVYNAKYLTLLGGFWKSPKYGWTEDLTAEQMMGLVSLQVYSVRRWAASHPYPDGRIGFAWNDEQGNAEFEQVAQRIAEAINAAYGENGTAAAACRSGADADYWCTRSVPAQNPDPRKRPRFNGAWETFSRWN